MTRRRQGRFARFVRRVRELFSGISRSYPPEDFPELEGGVGAREPRRPRSPSLSGAVALEVPPGETRDVWAVGEDDSR